MSIRLKPLIFVALLLLGIPVAGLISLNLYLQTPRIQQQIHSSLTAALGIPVSIGSVTVTPTGSLKLERLSATSEGQISLFTADSAIIRPCYFRLLKGEFSICKLALTHPVMQASLANTACLAAPSFRMTPQIQNGVALPAPSPTVKQPVQNTAQPPSQTTLVGVTTIFPHLSITDGEFTLLNIENRPIVSFRNISLQGDHTCAGGWNGLLQMGETTIGTGIILHDLRAPISITDNPARLILDHLTSVMGGGKLEGSFSLDLSPSASRYKTELTLSGATLNQFLSDASFDSSSAQGSITGSLQLSGIAGSGASMEGNGSLLCRDAILQPADFLRQIGEILQIDELRLLRLSESKCLFSIHAGVPHLDDLNLHSENLILDATGPFNLTGEMNLQARLLFNEKITSRIRGFLGSQLSQAPEPGYSQVTFHISGSPQNPKTDLLERLTGIHIGGGLGGFLQGLFGAPPAKH